MNDGDDAERRAGQRGLSSVSVLGGPVGAADSCVSADEVTVEE